MNFLEGKKNCIKAKCTSKLDIFKYLSELEQHELISHINYANYEAGDIIFRENDAIENIIFIRTGSVKLTRYESEGKGVILSLLSEGDIVGEDAFYDKDYYDYNVEALSDVTFCKINKLYFREMHLRNPNFEKQLIEYLMGRISIYNDRMQALLKDSALKRLACFLLSVDKDFKRNIGLTIDDIASSINVRRETASRRLSELQKLGYIERIGHKYIKVIDRKALENICN